MTDITDEKRAAVRFAKTVTRPVRGVPKTEDVLAAARYILATVDAQAPTLAEELRKVSAELRRDYSLTGSHSLALVNLATRAEQIENERDEARAEVERLTEERDVALSEMIKSEQKQVDLEAEVERLTADRFEKEVLDTIDAHYSAPDQQATPDPADVPPGEPWRVDVDGSRRIGLRCDPSDECQPWATHGPFSLDTDWEPDRRITLVSPLVPAPRVITTPDELDKLVDESVVMTADALVYQRDSDWWRTPGRRIALADEYVAARLPVTVLWEPEA